MTQIRGGIKVEQETIQMEVYIYNFWANQCHYYSIYNEFKNYFCKSHREKACSK